MPPISHIPPPPNGPAAAVYPIFTNYLAKTKDTVKGISPYIRMPKHQNQVMYRNSIAMPNMSKDELMKLSKDELIDMLQGQLAKRFAKRDVKRRQVKGTKNNVKPKTVKQITEFFKAKTMKSTNDRPDVFDFKTESLCHYVSTVKKKYHGQKLAGQQKILHFSICLVID